MLSGNSRAAALLLAVVVLAQTTAVGAPAPPLPGPAGPGERHPETGLRIAFERLPASVPARTTITFGIRATEPTPLRVTVLARRPGFPVVAEWRVAVRAGRSRIAWRTPRPGRYVISVEGLGRRVGAPVRVLARGGVR